jgi:hypothetical protein
MVMKTKKTVGKKRSALFLEPEKKKTKKQNPSHLPQIQKLSHHVDIHTGGALAPHGRTTSYPVRSSFPVLGRHPPSVPQRWSDLEFWLWCFR